MKVIRSLSVVLLLFLTACATNHPTQVVDFSTNASPDAPQAKGEASASSQWVFHYGEVIEVTGQSSITPAKMAKEQARSQAYLNLAKILKGVVLNNAETIIENYGADTSHLSERILADMASYGADLVASVAYADGKDGSSICTLKFDTKLVPSVYRVAAEAVAKEIEEEKNRLVEVTGQAVAALEEAEQLTEELRAYAYARLESQVQLLDAAFSGLEIERVLGTLEKFGLRMEI